MMARIEGEGRMSASDKQLLYLVAGYACFITSTQIEATQASLALGPALSQGIVGNAVYFSTFFCIALFSLSLNRRKLSEAVLAIGLSCVILIQVISLVCSVCSLQLDSFALFAMQMLSGASFAVVFCYWVSMAYYVSGINFRLCILFGSLLAAFVAIIVSAFTLPILRLATSIVFPICSLVFGLAFAKNVKRQRSFDVRIGKLPREYKKSVTECLKVLVVPLVCSAILGFAHRLSWVVVSASDLSSMFFAIGNAFAVTLIIMFTILPERRMFSVDKLFLWLCPFSLASLLPLYSQNEIFQLLFMGVTSVTFNLCNILVIFLCVDVGKRKNVSVFGLYAFAAGVLNLFPVLGQAVKVTLYDDFPLTLAVLVTIASAGLMYCAFALRNHRGNEVSMPLSEMQSLAAYASDQDDPVILGRTFIAAELAKEHGLTEREREILDMLITGRDVPAIAEKLLISKNTVRTHVKRIYQKMNVNSKQEILSLSEDVERRLEVSLKDDSVS